MAFFNKGILGINARNLLYINPFNKEKSIEMADDKLKTKAFLSARGIPVPKLLGFIQNRRELQKFNFNKLGTEFVIKPNLGYGGQGIIPIVGKTDNFFLNNNHQLLSSEYLLEHIQDILNGNFSVNDKPDKAFFEKLIVTDDFIKPFSEVGLPDIRVIVHNLVPVMAMIRIPTTASEGKANLHQGAYGAGIDLAKGEITHLIHNNKIVREISGRGSIKGLKIPFWDDILHIACQAQLATNLGYMGADIAIDRHQGPLLIEINARAGISIQLANLSPLRKRLEKLEGVDVKNIEKGIRVAKDMFGYSLEKNIRSISGKKVVGLYEKIEVFSRDNKETTIAFINTARKKSYIGSDLAKSLGLITSKRQKKLEEQRFKLKFKLGGKKLVSIFKIDKNIKKKYQAIIGNRDLVGQFLIDTSINNLISEKKSGETKKIFISNYDPQETDRQLCRIISQFKFLSYFRPINFIDEANKFLANNSYNPFFLYKEYGSELAQLRKDLVKIKFDDTDLGQLFKKKILELEQYFDLIENRGSQDYSFLSAQIFGQPDQKVIEEIQKISFVKTPRTVSRQISSEELKIIFEEHLKKYYLSDWRVILKKHLLTKCVVNKNKKILIKNHSRFNENRVQELLIHELDTHLLTSENGSRQKYRLFNFGFANYLETQEGLAMHNVVTQGHLYSEEKHKNILTKALFWAQRMSLAELFDHIKKEKLTDKSALNICFRVKRGLSDTSKPGAFTKDFCYYTGKRKIDEFLLKGGDLADLYLGKFSVDDLTSIKNVSQLKKALILPHWLRQ